MRDFTCKALGKASEMLAVKYLITKGFYIKWLGLFRKHDYDILGKKHNKLYKFEVKTIKHNYQFTRCFPDSKADYLITVKNAHFNSDGMLCHNGIRILNRQLNIAKIE